MDMIFPNYSDPFPCGSDFWSSHLPESSPVSPDSIGSAARPANFSDEEVMLASTHPKRRGGRKKLKETRHPVFRGVRRRNSSKWVCEVREPNKKSRIWLGTFPTAEMAARAHDVAAIALRGRSACLNFADSAWRLPIPASAEAKDIQKAASEGVEAFRPRMSEPEGVFREDVKQLENEVATPEDVFFMDEEAIFGMPELMANLAEGLMMPPPPHCVVGPNWYSECDVEGEADVSLWSYSI